MKRAIRMVLTFLAGVRWALLRITSSDCSLLTAAQPDINTWQGEESRTFLLSCLKIITYVQKQVRCAGQDFPSFKTSKRYCLTETTLCTTVARSGDGDFGAEVNVLDCVEKLDAFLHRALESFAAGDKTGTAGALINDGGGDGFLEIVCAGSAAAVDQACAS